MAFKRGRKPSSDRWGWYSKPAKKPIPEGSGIRGSGKYGVTWWGQQWLNAFNHISDSNRLPRGRTYANNGSVREIRIEGNVVHANVQGSHLYKVQIEIPKFTDQQKKEIGNIISDNPVLLSQLLNRELPADLHDLCRKNGIELFPRSWSTFHASCSCPDWAMPCKHLAAIIYLVANEIDKNPFLVFSLHDFDLAAALEQSGQTASAVSHPIPSVESLWVANEEGLPEPPAFDEALLVELDFSLVPQLHDTLPAILSTNPVFYPSGDFKAVYQKAITSIAKKAKGHTFEPAEAVEDRDYRRAEIIEISLNEHGAPIAFGVWDAEQNRIFHATQPDAWEAWLAGAPAGNLAALPADLRAVWLAWRFADVLAKQGAVVPQLLQTSGGACVVRWLPALLDERVTQLHRALSGLPSPYLMVTERNGASFVPAETDRMSALVSAFLHRRVSDFHGLDATAVQQPVHALFYKGAPVVFSKFEDKEYPAGIAQWLHHFFIAEKDLVPVLEVEEAGGGQFEVNLGLENKALPLEAPVPLAEIFENKTYAASRVEILRDLSVLAGCFPDLNRLLMGKGRKALRYPASEFAEVLLQVLPVIRLFGIRVLLPKSLARLLRPRLSLRMDSEGEDGKVLSGSGISLADMLSYKWQVAIGDYDISPEEFRKLTQIGSGLVKIRDEYAYFDEKETRALADKLARPPQLSGPQLLQTALTGEYEGVRVALSEKLLRLIRDLLSVDLMPLPQGLEATLRPYQHRGYSWLCKNARIGFGSILADDMGLGKTLQVISTLLYLKENGDLNAKRRALAIVPTTLLTNWQKEVARFAPGLSTAVYHGPSRALEAVSEADLVLTTYGVARSDTAKLEKQKWLALVIDEAQNIKNPATEQSKAIKKLTAPIRIALSGTPVENRLSEYWSVFDFSNKGYLGSLKGFKEQYAIPIEGERDQNALKRFHKATQPFVLRRLKSDKTIISDLPDKVEQNQFCTLTPDQAALYQNVVDLTMKKIENSDGIERRGLVLQLITTLKQICNHPAQYLKKGPAAPHLSGKCPLLLDLLDQSLENNEKTLIFTQFREMGELLIPIIRERFGTEPEFLHGGVSRKQRDAMVENFQTKSTHPILLLSLKAGGTGLNLTAAGQVIHYDLWWNPAVEAQATDRAYRIGQKRNVQVHRFVTAATFEERIDAMIQKKKELANLTVSSGEQWIGELSDRELRNLFSYG
ncbi:MAG: DEAD/DEAH box helicase family protein [Saprospiraceae bacterium]|nr:DEAD/DEAH box helicase family protein [Saprospiraceae bacterium]